jgi:hypothetical protein
MPALGRARAACVHKCIILFTKAPGQEWLPSNRTLPQNYDPTLEEEDMRRRIMHT